MFSLWPNGCTSVPSIKSEHLPFSFVKNPHNRAPVILSRHHNRYCGGSQPPRASARLRESAVKRVLTRAVVIPFDFSLSLWILKGGRNTSAGGIRQSPSECQGRGLQDWASCWGPASCALSLKVVPRGCHCVSTPLIMTSHGVCGVQHNFPALAGGSQALKALWLEGGGKIQWNVN